MKLKHKTMTLGLALTLILNPQTNPLASDGSHSQIIEYLKADNRQTAEEFKEEYELRLSLATYLATLEQNQVEEKVLDEYKEPYKKETDRLFSYLNTKKLTETDKKNLTSTHMIDSIITVSMGDKSLNPLTENNLLIVEEKIDDYINGGILIENPILRETEYEKYHQKSDLLSLMYAIIGSRNYTRANLIDQESYGQIIKEASEVLEDELSDDEAINLAYENLLAEAKSFNEKLKPNEETELFNESFSWDSLPTDINTDSDFYKNERYREYYINLSKEQRDELDEMRLYPAKKPYLTIDQLLSIKKYGLPVYETDWPYVFMYDRKYNGIVGETYQEDAIAADEKLAKAYKESTLENRYRIYVLDTNKDGYIDNAELEAAGLILDEEDNRWIISFMKQNEKAKNNVNDNPIPQTKSLENTANPQVIENQSHFLVKDQQTENLTTSPQVTTLKADSPTTNETTINSSSNVDTGITSSTGIITLLFASTVGYLNSKKSK